jgi:hypothetical protein
MVLLLISAVPGLSMPPPPPEIALFPLMVALLIIRVPRL